MPGKLKQHDLIPVVNYGQYRRARKLVHDCCNYDNGQCIPLARGRVHLCPEHLPFAFMRWFRCAVSKKPYKSGTFFECRRGTIFITGTPKPP